MLGKFIGTTSMGFVTGQMYQVKCVKRLYHDRREGKQKMGLFLFDLNSEAWCPYESMDAILRNWRFFPSADETPKAKVHIEYEDF